MAKKNDNRNMVKLVCTDCKSENYDITKNKKNTPDRIELKKYCNVCKKQTTHREKK